MKIIPISSCKPSKFISNMNELNSYFQVREKLQTITNVPRLINVVNVYLETLLFYSNNSKSKGVVKIGKNTYQTKIDGTKPDGTKIELDLIDIFESTLNKIVEDLAKVANNAQYAEFISILNSAIVTPLFDEKHKLSILNAENSLPKGSWHKLVIGFRESLAIATVELRLILVKKVLTTLPKYFETDDRLEENIIAIQNSYELFFKTLVRVHVANNHYVDIFTTIKKELDNIIELELSKGFDKNRIITFILNQLVLNNNLFQFESRSIIRELISEYESYVKSETASVLYEGIEFDPDNFELGRFEIGLAKPDFRKFDQDKIKTLLYFSIPFEIDEKQSVRTLEDGTIVEFHKISNLFDDPIYAFVDSAEISINGMPISFFADSLGNVGRTTKVCIILDSFYHPDFELEDGKMFSTIDDKEVAKRGGMFSPHKDLMIEYLWELKGKDQLPFEVDSKDLNSNKISNYLVSYHAGNGVLIHHQAFTITNFNSYFNAKKKFHERLTSNFHYQSSDIKDFLFNTIITSKKTFLEFCYTLLELTLKKSVEFGGLHISLWNNQTKPRAPISETHAQPIIYNQVRFIAEMKGVKVSREEIASDGSLDFNFSYTKNDVLMNVCVELKNAHHKRLEHGITSQLPLYINDIGNRMGIFLVLWYKGKEFNEPSKFEDIEILEKLLISKVPKKFTIKPMIIDCTKKESPSVSRSKERLKG